ncbi:MAG TPA: hypothetical protein VFA84_09335 [Acidimicrobiales bacterium]|nr:hypothetical protein [Acidimicrobiales bacterium]
MHTLAAVTWDPQLRGALILLVGVAILVGSVVLLLFTNLGLKLGVLVAAAGLSGLLLLLNVIWLMAPLGNGPIGYKGSNSGWKIQEIVQGDLAAHSAVPAVVGKPDDPSTEFPNGWTPLPTGNPLLASASPAADAALTPPAASAAAAPAPRFPPPFKTTQEYVVVGAWTKGGHNYLVNIAGYKVYWRIRKHQIYIKHQPHYVVIRVQPALPSVTLAGAAATLPAADPTKPVYSVVMLRDVGSLRLPPFLLGFGALIIFGITVEKLHSRDKEIARRRASGEDAPTGARPAGELQPA